MTSVIPNIDNSKNDSLKQRVQNLGENLGADYTNIDESNKLLGNWF